MLTHGAGPLEDVPAVVGNVGLQPNVDGVAGGLDSVLLQHELHHAIILFPRTEKRKILILGADTERRYQGQLHNW